MCVRKTQGDDFEIDVYPRGVSLTLRCRVGAPRPQGHVTRYPLQSPAQQDADLHELATSGALRRMGRKARLGFILGSHHPHLSMGD